MINYVLIERNKNKIVNLGIIILALIISFKIYQSSNVQVGSLAKAQNDELEKNKVIANIASFEQKVEAYKKVFVKRDLSSVMDVVSGIAKSASVRLVSVKPSAEEVMDNYLNSSFLITLTAPSYHALGDFISKIENHSDIYLVSDVSVNSVPANSDKEGANVNLSVSLKINTISYL
jgi:Tfp pilus assembly protein PilO